MEDGKRCSCVITRNGTSSTGIRWHAGFVRGGGGAAVVGEFGINHRFGEDRRT